jgi:2-dehydro-3-deoxy-D-gluconate 5-dehydrogenase
MTRAPTTGSRPGPAVLDLFSLSGRTALVTGASRGLGRAIAIALAGAGADVVCASSRTGGAADTSRQCSHLGRSAVEVHGDLSRAESVRRMLDDIDRLGPIDIVVNNAGVIRRHPAAGFPDEDWNEVIETNLNATFMICRHFGSQMVERKQGKIINVASLLSFQGGITVPAYTASKHAVAGLTKALANEWAQWNVQVNAIAPGYFRTDNTQALQDDPNRSGQILGRIPAGRWGDPQDLAGAAVFLASRASDYVSGHILVVDGGWMAR